MADSFKKKMKSFAEFIQRELKKMSEKKKAQEAKWLQSD